MDTNEEQSEPKLGRVAVSVTAELIEGAIPMDSSHCMIADAIKKAVPLAKAVSVDLASIRWTDPRAGKRYLYLTPPSVQAALIRFDNGQKPEPFRFTLRNPAQVVTSGTEGTQRGGRVTQGVARVSHDPHDVPAKIGGTLPPIGPLANVEKVGRHAEPEKTESHPAEPSEKTEEHAAKRMPDQANLMLQGRRRGFGIRKMGRLSQEIDTSS